MPPKCSSLFCFIIGALSLKINLVPIIYTTRYENPLKSRRYNPRLEIIGWNAYGIFFIRTETITITSSFLMSVHLADVRQNPRHGKRSESFVLCFVLILIIILTMKIKKTLPSRTVSLINWSWLPRSTAINHHDRRDNVHNK